MCRQWAVAIEEGGEEATVLGASFYVDPGNETEAWDNSLSLAKAQVPPEPLQLSLTLWGPQGAARLYRVQSLRKSVTQQREDGGALLALVRVICLVITVPDLVTRGGLGQGGRLYEQWVVYHLWGGPD